MKVYGIAAAIMMSVAASQAAILVDEQFIDGDFTDGTDAKDLNWQLYMSGPTLSIVSDNTTGPAEAGNDNALNINNAGQGFRGVYGILGIGVTLGVGDSLTLSYDHQFLASPGNTAASVRFGLYNSNATNTANNDNGYFARVSSGTGSPGIEVWKETGTDTVLSGGDNAVVVGGSGSGFVGLTTASVNLSMVLTRTASSALKIDVKQNGTTVWSVTDVSASFFTYDEIALGTGTNNPQFRLDNISLVSVVPEPATLGLMSLAGTLLGMRRRR